MIDLQAEGLDSYIIGLRETAALETLRQLRPGTELRLAPSRQRGTTRLEIRTSAGEPLGWLPPEDGLALTGISLPLTGRVTALVPARLLPRVHIRVFSGC